MFLFSKFDNKIEKMYLNECFCFQTLKIRNKKFGKLIRYHIAPFFTLGTILQKTYEMKYQTRIIIL